MLCIGPGTFTPKIEKSRTEPSRQFGFFGFWFRLRFSCSGSSVFDFRFGSGVKLNRRTIKTKLYRAYILKSSAAVFSPSPHQHKQSTKANVAMDHHRHSPGTPATTPGRCHERRAAATHLLDERALLGSRLAAWQGSWLWQRWVGARRARLPRHRRGWQRICERPSEPCPSFLRLSSLLHMFSLNRKPNLSVSCFVTSRSVTGC